MEEGGGGVEQLLKKKNRRHVKISRSATPLMPEVAKSYSEVSAGLVPLEFGLS